MTPVLVAGRGNIKDASNKRDMQKYLNKCHYNEEKEPYCPNFRLGYIADQARENFSELCRTVSVTSVTCAVSDFKNVHMVEKDVFLYTHISYFEQHVCHFIIVLHCLRSVSAQGGVIGVFINWKCNLDLDPSHCKPTYSFRRLDLDQANSSYYYR